MEKFSNILLAMLCIVLPFISLVFVLFAYNLGVGGISVRGVARGEADAKKHWTTVSELTEKLGQCLATTTTFLGSVLAFLGFLLPWQESTSGIALLLSFITDAFEQFDSGFEGATLNGMVFMLLALLMLVILAGLILANLVSLGMVSIHLGYTKGENKRFSRPALIIALVGFVFSCGFLGIIQGVHGLSQADVDIPFQVFLDAEMASGFWFTVWGFFLALIGALFANKLAGRFAEWVESLTTLNLE